MGYKQKGFSKHATKSAFKRVDDKQTQDELGDLLGQMQSEGATHSEMYDAIKSHPGHDGTTTYMYTPEGKIKTAPRTESGKTGKMRWNDALGKNVPVTYDMSTLYQVDPDAEVRHFNKELHPKPKRKEGESDKAFKERMEDWKYDAHSSKVPERGEFGKDENVTMSDYDEFMDKHETSDTGSLEGGAHESGSKYENTKWGENIDKGEKRRGQYDY